MQQDNQALIDILQAAERVQAYVADSTLTDFYADIQLQNKVMRRLLTISKAAQQVSVATREEMSAIAWDRLSSTKERILQEDPSIDIDQLWATIHTEIPALIQALKQLVPVKEQDDAI
ncbi:MAG: HepT-like ribonuclease domain-containing protein [Phormidesmis sp.]